MFDILDKNIFEAIPIFVDSLGQFIKLQWPLLYKGSIRDFYPNVAAEKRTNVAPYIEQFSGDKELIDKAIAQIGTRIAPEALREHIDFAFLVLHGYGGEDGSIQGLLQHYQIPYSGSGIFSSALGIDKALQKRLLQNSDFNVLSSVSVNYEDWQDLEFRKNLFLQVNQELQLPLVVKPATQGSSIGISFLHSNLYQVFEEAIDRSFFIDHIAQADWESLSPEERRVWVRELVDLQNGIGLPMVANRDTLLYHADQLLEYLEENPAHQESIRLEAQRGEHKVLIEEMANGQEFSCIVLRDHTGKTIALPPTGILNSGELFDYRAKYLPGISRKETPMRIFDEVLQRIREECEKLFDFMGCQVYARLDGFVTEEGSVYLNDPNTTSGMLPSSFFFHQAAEIGLPPSELITFIILGSLQERFNEGMRRTALGQWRNTLMQKVHALREQKGTLEKVAVIMGGSSFERHISVESGRNVYHKLAASGKYEVWPIFLTQKEGEFQFYELPINLLLKDNADDILNKLHFDDTPDVINWIRQDAEALTGTFGLKGMRFQARQILMSELSERADFAFLALHGRPGEDGTLQNWFSDYDLPYNGSGPKSAALTIDKYRTNELLREHGIRVPPHCLVRKEHWQDNPNTEIENLEAVLDYPIIVKPVDDGCSAAVLKIDNRSQLVGYAELLFRDGYDIPETVRDKLPIRYTEEYPMKTQFLAEALIGPEGAARFMEITGGMLIEEDNHGQLHYECFEPSEAVAGESILSLEEKFLAGEGQNITPARFSENPEAQERISRSIQNQLQRVAEILEVYGYCRVDAFVRIFEDDEPELVVIEVNSLPGLTPATALFHQAARSGYTPAALLDKIIQNGKVRKAERVST